MHLRKLVGAASLALLACGDDAGGGVDGSSSATVTATESTTDTTSTNTSISTSTTNPTSTTGGSDTGFKFDLPSPDGGGTDTGLGPTCKVVDDMNAVGECRSESPPDSFEPDIQWDWWGPNGEDESLVPALVANLTDDNGDDEIDLCDVPDVVITATDFPNNSHIYVLDGETGTLIMTIPTEIAWSITPAIGDIDNDLLPEIAASLGPGFGGGGQIVVFEHDGTIKWTNQTTWTHSQGGSIAIADLDNDGNPEIIGERIVVDNQGNTVFVAPPQVGSPQNTATTAADLDGDGDLEVILGQSAYHHDGTPYYNQPGVQAGFPQVADLDQDGLPEVLVNNFGGLTVLEHDGAIKYQDLRPTGETAGNNWFRPSTVHDFDGDDVSEYAVSSRAKYAVYEGDATIVWQADVIDASGWAAGTAFDFLGDGVAEAMYADETNLFIYDGNGVPLLTVPRSARTLTEYPIVADVDNDGSAEIVVVSDAGFANNQTAPTVQVVRDIQDRWIQARRIWNQHTYHVTNVREDSTIPQFEPPHWESLNTFRTNAQIEGGEVCKPPPPG